MSTEEMVADAKRAAENVGSGYEAHDFEAEVTYAMQRLAEAVEALAIDVRSR